MMTAFRKEGFRRFCEELCLCWEFSAAWGYNPFRRLVEKPIGMHFSLPPGGFRRPFLRCVMKFMLRTGVLCSLAAAISACNVANSQSDPPVNSLAAAPAPAGPAKRLEMVPAPVGTENAPADRRPVLLQSCRASNSRASNPMAGSLSISHPRGAQRVRVSINNVSYDMVKGDNGQWTYTSAPQAPGYHNYWMVVDGAIVLDPETYAYIGYSRTCNGF